MAAARVVAAKMHPPASLLPCVLVCMCVSSQVTAAARADVWDVAFCALDPGRAVDIAFTHPYVVIEGTYMVHQASPFTRVEELDSPGVRIAAREVRCARIQVALHGTSLSSLLHVSCRLGWGGGYYVGKSRCSGWAGCD